MKNVCIMTWRKTTTASSQQSATLWLRYNGLLHGKALTVCELECPILAPSRPPFKLLVVEKAHRFYHVLLPGLQRIECALRAPQPTQSSTPNPFCISNPDRSNPISNALSLSGGPPVSLFLDLGNNFQAITDYYRPCIPNASRFLAILNS